MSSSYDAIVIGARCAGSPTAMLLARKGYRVLLLDRATFPSDHMSTHYIHQPGIAKLKRWGLLDRLVATGCPPVRQHILDFGPIILKGTPPPADGVAEGYGPRRTVLDKILVDAAVEAGVELREGFAVQDLLWDGDSVIGMRGAGRNGATVTEHARVVIGADGLHSVVARNVHAVEYQQKPLGACAFYTYWSGVPVEGFANYARDRRGFGAIPTHDGLTCIIVGWPNEEFDKYRSDIEGNYLKTLELAPDLAERVRHGMREERFVGTSDLPDFFRKPYGPGWALVGDAGYHKHPITAQGITDAFRDAEQVADAVDAGLSGRRTLEEALAGYEEHRNSTVMPLYEFTNHLATMQPPSPEMQQLLPAIAANQEATDQFMGLIAGTTPFPQFFAPENVQRIVAAAQQGNGRSMERGIDAGVRDKSGLAV